MSLQTVPPATLKYGDPASTPLNRVRGGDILASGFAITVAAWITAYLSRMPLVNASGQVTVGLMLGMVLVGGFLAARYSRKGVWAALGAGTVSGVLDILVVGSLIHDMAGSDSIAPVAALWMGGSILCNTVVAGLGGVLGMFLPSGRRDRIPWSQVFATILAVATLPLISIGGLVTAFRAGLAVPDWPQSYGYNMFLFPLSRMQSNQGNFYEHAHRLMGSLVGLTSLTVAIYISVTDRRRWVKMIAWGIFVAVCIQGLLGGTRVTERSVPLAMAHGIFAQMVFASMACLAAVTGRGFMTHTRVVRESAVTEQRMAGLFVGAMLVQLTLGAWVRHTDGMLIGHILMAAVVAALAVACGVRAWGLYADQRPLRNTGVALLGVVSLQLLLGIFALVFRAKAGDLPTREGALLTTAHQANGALLLALASVLAIWVWRLLAPTGGATGAGDESRINEPISSIEAIHES